MGGELPFPDNLSGPQLLVHIAKFVNLSQNINPVQVPPNNIISNSLTNLVNELLIVDPEKRISLDDFLDRLKSCNTIAEDIVEEVVESLIQNVVDSKKMERQEKCARWLRSLKNDPYVLKRRLKRERQE